MNNYGDISMLQIEVFLTVADCKSITAAARKLYISQSAATRLMQKLEAYMNTTLMERTNHGVELTDNGVKLYRMIKQLYSRMNAAFHDARFAGEDGQKVVRIACAENNEIFDEVASLIKQFENLYSDLTVDLKICSFHDMREGILSGIFDCIFTYSVSGKGLAGIETRYYKKYDTYFAVSASSKAIEDDRLNHARLADYYIFMNPLSRFDLMATRELGICKLHGFEPKEIRYISDEPVVANMVMDDIGFCVCGPGFGIQLRDKIRLFRVEKPLKEEQYMVLLWNPEARSDNGRKFVESIPYIRLERSAEYLQQNQPEPRENRCLSETPVVPIVHQSDQPYRSRHGL